ncbi:helix-turn-helix domain-containing protein [uncultured Amnibacterium sp.]|uniref:AraC-like ligand-binding domain-containing protein n=1 Tax=uncultured Amnibacterium sp. TaxID=1631851 RepID=UPI0035CA3BF7
MTTRDPAVFADVVSSAFVPLAVERDRRAPFAARVRSVVSASVAITDIQATAHRVVRVPRSDDSSDAAYKLSLVTAGRSIVAQDGREAVLGPGDLVLYETSRPYVLEMDRDFDVVVVMLPHGAVSLPPSRVDQLTAVRMPGDVGVGQIVAAFLTSLVAQDDALNRASREGLGRCAADLITTLLGQHLAPSEPQPRQRAIIDGCKAYIETQLGSPVLAPADIAAAQHISPRYLHALFHEQGTTVSNWIRARRLERCHHDLMDPMLASLPVAAIAARWGFLDAAHFSRVFRSSFGCSPSSLRSAASS